jgi:uncharacterized protein YkwD
VRLARSAFSAALASVALVLALTPALGSARRPAARAAASDAMVQKINQVRARYGLRRLRAAPSLSGSSRRYAARLMRADVLRHSSRGASGRSGEVLAVHFGRSPRVGSTVARWMGSPSHRAVLLSRSMGAMGAGYAQGRWGSTPAVIWVARFGGR